MVFTEKTQNLTKESSDKELEISPLDDLLAKNEVHLDENRLQSKIKQVSRMEISPHEPQSITAKFYSSRSKSQNVLPAIERSSKSLRATDRDI